MAPTNATSEVNDIISVELPRAHLVLSELMGISWAAIGLVRVFSSHSVYSYDRVGDVLNAIPYVILGVLFSWQAMAHRRIIISPEELKYELRGLGMARVKSYPLGEIKNLRVDARHTFIHGRRIALDRNGRRKFITDELAPSSPSNLLDPIYERFPQLAPGN